MCKILCNNMFCVYWSRNTCILDEVHLDALGICTQSIHVDIDEKVLENKRIEMLCKFYKREENINKANSIS